MFRGIRICLVIVIVGLVIAGVTAFPLEAELQAITSLLHAPGAPWTGWFPDAAAWFDRVSAALQDEGARYPFLAYGTDWLAFAHLMIAVAFIGPLRDPVKNRWVVQWGIFMCVAIIPLALIAGPIRGIPWGWTLIDMSFGVVAIVPLIVADRLIGRVEREH